MKRIFVSFMVCLILVCMTSCVTENDGATDYLHNSEEVTENDGATDCLHNWEEATCESPKTCTLCNKFDGEALGHQNNGDICDICGLDVPMQKLRAKLLSSEFNDGEYTWKSGFTSVMLDKETDRIYFSITLQDGSAIFISSVNYMSDASPLEVVGMAAINDATYLNNGYIYPETYSADNDEVYSYEFVDVENTGIDYSESFKVYFEQDLALLFEMLGPMFSEIGITLSDLGFTSY